MLVVHAPRGYGRGATAAWRWPSRRRAEARADRSARALAAVNAFIAVYGVASMGLVATRRVGLTAEHAILLVLIGAGMVPRLRTMVRAWLPFLFVAVMFEDLGAVQPLVAGAVHTAGPAVFERNIFGVNVAPWLQQHLGGLHGAQWWQIPLVFEYLAHFVAPILAAGYLWLRARQRFGDFVAVYSLVMAAGFAVYLIFPEMPPWLAAQQGLVQPVQRIVVGALDHVPVLGSVYAGADPFPDGAMPSLHVAVPMAIALAMIAARGHGRARWLWLLYPLTISFAVVDLGEHYVADAVVGLAFGALCFYAVTSLRWKRVADAAMPAATKPVASSRAVASE